MFLLRRPSESQIARFLDDSRRLPLSYGPAGCLDRGLAGGDRDEICEPIGQGRAHFEHACTALERWAQFDLGWVSTFPRDAPVAEDTAVAVLIRHLGFWSLNGARILSRTGGATEGRFGFVYGTLPTHAEMGEEQFEVFLDERTSQVMYRIRATSRPRAALARIGYPIVRLLQARFRRDSVAAMRRAACLPHHSPQVTDTTRDALVHCASGRTRNNLSASPKP